MRVTIEWTSFGRTDGRGRLHVRDCPAGFRPAFQEASRVVAQQGLSAQGAAYAIGQALEIALRRAGVAQARVHVEPSLEERERRERSGQGPLPDDLAAAFAGHHAHVSRGHPGVLQTQRPGHFDPRRDCDLCRKAAEKELRG